MRDWDWSGLNESVLQIVCDGKTEYEHDKPLVVIGTPCFGGLVSQDYTMSLLNLPRPRRRRGSIWRSSCWATTR